MFGLSREKLQQLRAIKPLHSVKELFKGIDFDEFFEPNTKVEMPTAFTKFFERYTRIVDPEVGVERLYVFDTIHLCEAMCCTWTELYALVTTSQEEVLREKALLDKEIIIII